MLQERIQQEGDWEALKTLVLHLHHLTLITRGTHALDWDWIAEWSPQQGEVEHWKRCADTMGMMYYAFIHKLVLWQDQYGDSAMVYLNKQKVVSLDTERKRRAMHDLQVVWDEYMHELDEFTSAKFNMHIAMKERDREMMKAFSELSRASEQKLMEDSTRFHEALDDFVASVLR